VKEIVGIRGLPGQVKVFDDEVMETIYWNPLLFAINSRNLELVKFIVNECSG
jgi:hypothetical protein